MKNVVWKLFAGVLFLANNAWSVSGVLFVRRPLPLFDFRPCWSNCACFISQHFLAGVYCVHRRACGGVRRGQRRHRDNKQNARTWKTPPLLPKWSDNHAQGLVGLTAVILLPQDSWSTCLRVQLFPHRPTAHIDPDRLNLRQSNSIRFPGKQQRAHYIWIITIQLP